MDDFDDVDLVPNDLPQLLDFAEDLDVVPPVIAIWSAGDVLLSAI